MVALLTLAVYAVVPDANTGDNVPLDNVKAERSALLENTLLTVIPLPVRSAITTAASAPAFQSSAAARLYVVPPIDEVPFLFNMLLTPARSVAFSVTEKEVPLGISTDEVVKVYVELP